MNLNLTRAAAALALLIWLAFDEHSLSFTVVVVAVFIGWAIFETIDMRREAQAATDRAAVERMAWRNRTDRVGHAGTSSSESPHFHTRADVRHPSQWRTEPDQ